MASFKYNLDHSSLDSHSSPPVTHDFFDLNILTSYMKKSDRIEFWESKISMIKPEFWYVYGNDCKEP